ncbi:MAG: translation elongation factor Ts [Phycisphaerae bacterium]|nr:translation elongation factor Ts [Phycisphaerae bacterium]|tara:strand:+ start:9035 stop:9826 length:792 start_codon:yes stop_codon:yes gene_type:complete
MSFTAKDVMGLRQKTGLGMMDCKKALTETSGDPVAAEEWLREKKKGKMDTRTERTTGEGKICIASKECCAVIVEVRTETDFTARNENFVEAVENIAELALETGADGEITANDAITKLVDDLRITTGENANYSRGFKYSGGKFGDYIHHDGKRACLLQFEGDMEAATVKGICQHIVFHDPMGISADDVPADKIEQIRADAIKEAKDAGKNEEIAEKMSEGKVRKHLQEHTLLAQKYVLDESTTIQALLGEGTTITAFTRYTLGS